MPMGIKLRYLIVAQAAVLALLGSLPRMAHGQLVAQDPFIFTNANGYKLSSLNGQNPIVVPGFTGQGSQSWEATSSSFRVVGNSLSTQGFPISLGGSVEYLGSANDGFQIASRKFDHINSPDPYFVNFLLNPGSKFNAGSVADAHALVGFTSSLDEADFRNSPLGNPVTGAMVGFVSRRPSPLSPLQIDLVLRAANGNGDLEDTVLLSNIPPDTFQVVLKFDSDSSGARDKITYWVNPTNTASESAMTATSLAADTLLTNALLPTIPVSQLSIVTDSWNRDFVIDEPRHAGGIHALFSIPLQCDLNGDGTVDASDMGILFANWNKPGLGDLNGDGIVDAADAGICFAEWTGDPPTPAWNAPEPQLGIVWGLALVLFRRRRLA